MSIMMVDYKKASALVNGICEMKRLWNCKDFLFTTNEGSPMPTETKRFVTRLYKANALSFAGRYKEEPDTIAPIKDTDETMNKYQTLKTLQSLIYNIDDEHLQDHLMLIGMADEARILEAAIINLIITTSPEYEAAQWG